MGIVQSSISGSTYLIVTMDMEIEWETCWPKFFFMWSVADAIYLLPN